MPFQASPTAPGSQQITMQDMRAFFPYSGSRSLWPHLPRSPGTARAALPMPCSKGSGKFLLPFHRVSTKWLQYLPRLLPVDKAGETFCAGQQGDPFRPACGRQLCTHEARLSTGPSPSGTDGKQGGPRETMINAHNVPEGTGHTTFSRPACEKGREGCPSSTCRSHHPYICPAPCTAIRLQDGSSDSGSQAVQPAGKRCTWVRFARVRQTRAYRRSSLSPCSASLRGRSAASR